jgi:cell division protease FtsH
MTSPLSSPPDRRTLIIMAVIGALLMLAIVLERRSSRSTTESLPYSEVRKLLHAKQITEVEITGDDVRGQFKSARHGKTGFTSVRVDSDLADELDAAGVRYSRREESSGVSTLIFWVLPGLAIFIALAAARRGAGMASGPHGALAISKSRAKVYAETNTSVTFDDVAGVDEAKQELQEVVAFLKDPKAYGRLGARMPKGVLLVGPPGTGKTLLARAVAGEAHVPFFSISGSEFVELFVGVGAARVRDLFEQARAKAPSIIFIDELDALGRARNGAAYFGGQDEKEQTLNQLLAEVDGFDASSGVVLLAATNRPEILDPALLRAGRFDRQVLVDRPDKKGRVDILLVHVRKICVSRELQLHDVAAMTPGFTGADLANLVNEAALAATRRSADEVTIDDFTVAIERIVAGLEKRNRLLNPLERRIVAHHEAGHALVARALARTETVQKVSIIPRGIGGLGYTLQRPIEDRYLMTRGELDDKLAVLMGGRAAEQLIFECLSTGAADDLAKATAIARSMATHYAMVPDLGHLAYEDEPSPFLGAGPGYRSHRPYSDETARHIDSAVKQIVQRGFERAHRILVQHRDLLESTAQRLLEKETLSEPELSELLAPVQRPMETKTAA